MMSRISDERSKLESITHDTFVSSKSETCFRAAPS